VGLSFALKLGLHPSTFALLGKQVIVGISLKLDNAVGCKPSFQARL
jgi:hypothetical protein